MPEKNNKFECILVSKKIETSDIITLKFKLDEDSGFSFVPGQYVTVYLGGQFGPVGKAYTISSIPDNKFIEMSVKKIGKFSTALHELKIKSTIVIEGPVGRFFPEEKSAELVFLAAGIGVTPFLSIIKAYAKDNSLINKKIALFYSNKTRGDVAFFDEFNKLSEDNKNLELFYYLTRQKIKDEYIKEFNRIDIESVKSKLNNLKNKEYFICGPIRFVFDIRKALLNEGINEFNIHTEAFY